MNEKPEEFGLDPKDDLSKVVKKLATFLSRTYKKASRLSSKDQKERMLFTALKVVEDTCRAISWPESEQSLINQTDVNTGIPNEKMGVQPLSRWRLRDKSTWIYILNYLIPTLSNERKMFFLSEQTDIEGILDLIIDSTEEYSYAHNSFENKYYISWYIIKRSFDMASLKGRQNVKLEDLLTSISTCDHLDKSWRSKLAMTIFDIWYRSPTYNK